MAKQLKCPECKGQIYARNGYTKENKSGEKKQKYLCDCGRQFVEKTETLSRTEKRIFSLFYNLITHEAKESDTLKTLASVCNEEVRSIGKLDLQVTKEEINFDKLTNVALIACFNEKENEIKIIKTYPEEIVYTLKDLIKKNQKILDE